MLHSLLGLHVDPTVNLNTIINAAVGAVVTAIFVGMQHIFRDVRAFIKRMSSVDERLEDTAEVVDQHSDVLSRTGWVKNQRFKAVSRQRRSGDTGTPRNEPQY